MTSLQDIVETFELLGDWDQRYQYLVELGENMPALPDEARTDENKVKGCMSQVWISASLSRDKPGNILFHGDCDTSIIKGVLALLFQLSEDRTADDIERLDVDEFFEKLGLDDHLSPNRHVGVYAIVELMKKQARALAAKPRVVA